jgi:hypothetical protein
VGSTVISSSYLLQYYYSNNERISAFQIPGSGVYSNLQSHIEMASGPFINSGTCADQNHSVFYKFRPSVAGRYEFSTSGSSYDTVIMVDDGAGFSACNENRSLEDYTSRLRVVLAAGTTYIISIGETDLASPPQYDNMLLSLRVRKL